MSSKWQNESFQFFYRNSQMIRFAEENDCLKKPAKNCIFKTRETIYLKDQIESTQIINLERQCQATLSLRERLWRIRKSLCTVHKSQHNCFLHPQRKPNKTKQNEPNAETN